LRDPADTKGPLTVFDPYLMKNNHLDYGEEHTDNHVFVERKFREFVMKWLSNGKPKLFRSETEGNMIVVATAVTFTPFQESQRMVYTASMTLTEIAPYDLESLLDYNLLPNKIQSYYDNNSEFEFVRGDIDPYLNSALAYIPSGTGGADGLVGGVAGQPIQPINTYPWVINGIPPFTFWSPDLVALGYSINSLSGVITGNYSTHLPTTIELFVQDSTG